MRSKTSPSAGPISHSICDLGFRHFSICCYFYENIINSETFLGKQYFRVHSSQLPNAQQFMHLYFLDIYSFIRNYVLYSTFTPQNGVCLLLNLLLICWLDRLKHNTNIKCKVTAYTCNMVTSPADLHYL